MSSNRKTDGNANTDGNASSDVANVRAALLPIVDAVKAASMSFFTQQLPFTLTASIAVSVKHLSVVRLSVSSISVGTLASR